MLRGAGNAEGGPASQLVWVFLPRVPEFRKPLRVLHVRYVSSDEDRLCIRNGCLAGNLAGLVNTAISIVRLKDRLPPMSEANHHCAVRQGNALE